MLGSLQAPKGMIRPAWYWLRTQFPDVELQSWAYAEKKIRFIMNKAGGYNGAAVKFARNMNGESVPYFG